MVFFPCYVCSFRFRQFEYNSNIFVFYQRNAPILFSVVVTNWRETLICLSSSWWLHNIKLRHNMVNLCLYIHWLCSWFYHPQKTWKQFVKWKESWVYLSVRACEFIFLVLLAGAGVWLLFNDLLALLFS